jgi:hypothetical protein
MKCQNPLKKYQNVLKCISIFNKQYTIMQFCGYQVNSIKKNDLSFQILIEIIVVNLIFYFFLN